MNKEANLLSTGASIMAPVMGPHGFVFSTEGEGHSSGGDFAYGSWQGGNRELRLHFRFSLGLVTYHFHDLSAGHEWYLWAMAGKKQVGKYPRTSNDPLEAFHDLSQDLQAYGTTFLTGSDEELEMILKKANDLQKWWESLSPLKRLDVK